MTLCQQCALDQGLKKATVKPGETREGCGRMMIANTIAHDATSKPMHTTWMSNRAPMVE